MKDAKVIVSNPEEKKHSVLYKAAAGTITSDPAITSVYVMKTALGAAPYPAKLEITIKEAK